MARVKLVYLGGGSTRAAGTMASFMANGADFDGSEVVLVDLDPERLELIRTLATKMARARGLDISVTRDDRPPRRARRRRRGALLLPAGRLPGAGAGREDPAPARRHRPGDPGRGRLLHGAPRDQRAQGRLRRDGGALPRRVDLQLHEPRQHRRRGDHAQLAAEGRLALRRPDLLPQPGRRRGRARPREAARHDGRPQPRLLGRRAGLRRRRPDAAARRGLGAPPGRRDARPRAAAAAPARRRDGLDPRRLLPVLLLHRRGAGRVPRQADDAGGGHPLLVGRLLAPLRAAGA